MIDQYFRPRNWGRHQGYQKRGAVWIKNYTALLSDPDYSQLTPNCRATLHGLWLLTGSTGRPLPLNTRFIGAQLSIDCRAIGVALKILLSKNFIELCDKYVALCDDVRDKKPALEENRVDKNRVEDKEGSGANAPTPPLIEVVDCHDAVEEWNTLAKECDLPIAQRVTKSRQTKVKRRLSECGGIDGWKAAMDKIRNSPFLLGENDRGWKADFDFVLQETSFTKIMEGKYDRSKGNGALHGGRSEESDRRAILTGVGLESFRRG